MTDDNGGKFLMFGAGVVGLVFLGCLCCCLRKSFSGSNSRKNDGHRGNRRVLRVLVAQRTEGGTTNTFGNRCFQGDVHWSPVDNIQFASGQETVVDHRMPIIFGALPTDSGQHGPARTLRQQTGTPPLNPVDSSRQPSSPWPSMTTGAHRIEGQQDVRSAAVPVPGSETTSYEQSMGVHQGDVDEYERFHSLPTYEEVMRQKQDTVSSTALN
ncbi:uncharacterized protein [Ptychodera flava]|uniref:uncharacterized protein n=1 Tax=Ptychodera flava TaxID=63121 RepID=UPI00396A825E